MEKVQVKSSTVPVKPEGATVFMDFVDVFTLEKVPSWAKVQTVSFSNVKPLVAVNCS